MQCGWIEIVDGVFVEVLRSHFSHKGANVGQNIVRGFIGRDIARPTGAGKQRRSFRGVCVCTVASRRQHGHGGRSESEQTEESELDATMSGPCIRSRSLPRALRSMGVNASVTEPEARVRG